MGAAMATSAEWVMHPGYYIREEMEARGWLQRDLAFILGCSEQALNRILQEKQGISPDMAKALAEAFDVPAEFFANLQQAYDLSRARTPDPSVAARRDMQSTYPVREMIVRRWLQLSDIALLESQLARFFEVNTPGEIPYMAHAAKRSHYVERDIPPAQLAWLFRVRQIARSISVPQYSEKDLKNALIELETLLIAPEEVRHVPRILTAAGVRFIVAEKLPNTKIDGMCFWLDDKSPVVGMSLQHDRIDNFWFVLRHEIEHVLRRHGRQQEMIDTDLEGAGGSTQKDAVSEDERVANEAAANFCAPADRLESFMRRKHPFYYEKDVVAFSRTLNRHPGVVIGQVRRRLDRYDYLTRYLVKIRPFVIAGATTDGWGRLAPVSL